MRGPVLRGGPVAVRCLILTDGYYRDGLVLVGGLVFKGIITRSGVSLHQEVEGFSHSEGHALGRSLVLLRGLDVVRGPVTVGLYEPRSLKIKYVPFV